MSKYTHPKDQLDFTDAYEVCRTLHGEDQQFTVKLLQRDSDTLKITNVTSKHGLLSCQADMFQIWHDKGLEPFVMTGLTDGKTLGNSSVHGTWALAVDLDHYENITPWVTSLIRPTFVINTSEARHHFCWVLTEELPKNEATHFLSAMAHRLGADPCFANSAQAVRLPGFINHKYGTQVTLAIPPGNPPRVYSANQLSLGLDVELVTACLRSKLPAFNDKLSLPKTVPKDHVMDDLKNALTSIPADDYSVWLKVGIALHSIGDDGFQLWDTWSQKSSKYDSKNTNAKWKSFTNQGAMSLVSVSSVFFLAAQAGWSNPGFRHDDKGLSIESLTERTVGRLIAQMMKMDFAAIRSGAGEKEIFRLLKWDGMKYADLDNSARREHVERYLKKLIAEMGDTA